MSAFELGELLQQSHDTVKAMLADGIDADMELAIEHHLASPDFSKLEKAAVELVKLGYHVDEADEFDLEDGSRWFCFAAITEATLNEQVLAQQTREVADIAEQCDVEYDGWGTDFGDDDDDEDE